jgi:hypothetical protein
VSLNSGCVNNTECGCVYGTSYSSSAACPTVPSVDIDGLSVVIECQQRWAIVPHILTHILSRAPISV